MTEPLSQLNAWAAVCDMRGRAEVAFLRDRHFIGTGKQAAVEKMP